MVFMMIPIRSLVDSVASKTHASFDLKSLVLLLVRHAGLFLLVLQGIARAIGVFQFLASILDGFIEFHVLKVNEIDSS